MSHGFNSHFMARIAATLSNTPFRTVCSYHGLYHAPTPAHRMIGAIYNRFTEHYIRRRACSTVAVAEYSRGYLIEKGTDPARVEVIHNGISDLEQNLSARERLREEWGIHSGEVLVGIASRFDPIKGIAGLVDAFGRVAGNYPQAKLVLIGAGSLDDALRAQVGSLGLSDRVIFTGFRTDIAACLEAMDVFVLPSLAESHSISLLEAMRAAKAIIATDVGGNTESARHEQEALIVPPADAAALAAALVVLGGLSDGLILPAAEPSAWAGALEDSPARAMPSDTPHAPEVVALFDAGIDSYTAVHLHDGSLWDSASGAWGFDYTG